MWKYLALLLLTSYSYGFEQIHDQNNLPVRWPDYNNIPFQFDSHCPKVFRTAVLDCLQEWTNATGVRFQKGADSNGKNPNGGIIFVWARNFDANLAASITGGSTTPETAGNGVLVRATVVLNGRFYSWHRGAPTMRMIGTRIDFSYDYILLHEIGHAIGLAHNDLIDSIMYGKVGHTFVGSDDVLGAMVLSGKSK